jgi:hypothetical protein
MVGPWWPKTSTNKGIATETSERTRPEVVVVTLTEARPHFVMHASLLVVLHHGGRALNISSEVRKQLSIDKAGLRGDGTAMDDWSTGG